MINNTCGHLQQYKDILCCPSCGSDLVFTNGIIECTRCRKVYQTSNGIPLLFIPDDYGSPRKNVTTAVKSFYEEHPFPNYDDLDDAASLIERAYKGLFAKLLDSQIPFGARILEAGCGTGQLSNFLSIANRNVFGVDLSINSLMLAQRFKKNNKLEHVNFFQMNLFYPAFKPKSFDLIICNGVLHHTQNPSGGFRSIANLLKENGYIIIGLYHKYGRIATDIRRLIFKLSGNRLTFLDNQLKDLKKVKRDSWFMDQYANPHESKHTFKEVLMWFARNGFQFVKSVPKTKLFTAFSVKEKLFKPEPHGSWLELIFCELKMIFTGSGNGGLFMMIGQKKSGK